MANLSVDKDMGKGIHRHIHTHSGVLFNCEEQWSYIDGWKMNIAGDHHIKENHPGSERQLSYAFSHSSILDLIQMYKIIK